MFLKNANVKNRSITTSLTLFYSLASFALIAVVSLFLYGTMVHLLHNANYQFLSNEVDILAVVLNKSKINQEILEHKVIEVPYTKTGSVYHYYIRILDQKNNTVIETPDMKNVFRNAIFFDKATIPADKEIDWWNSYNGHNYLLIQSPALNGETQNKWRIEVALDISYQQAMIRKGRMLFAIVLPIFILFAVFFGYFIARKGMRSLHELTDATQKMTASSLHQKIDPESWPTELKELGMAFNKMLERIEISFSQLTQFSADLAHELRTPINNLMGQTEITLSRTSSVENYQHVLGSNLEELQRISQIIENLLFLARAENLQLDQTKTFLNAEEEIKLICSFYESLADEKNIKLHLEGFAIVYAHSVMFRRAMSNILSNALKYTPVNGAVNIKINQTQSHAQIIVSDNGIGIDPEHLPKVFNRFYRIDSARSQHSGGTGLGLAIVKSIIDLHNGALSIQSHPGNGTSVHVLLASS